MQVITRVALLAMVVSTWGTGIAGADPILNLTPGVGAISGAAGDTIGWGFSLTNPDDVYMVITSADFCGAAISSPCSTSLGTFTDFIAQFNFTYVDPQSSISAAFDAGSLSGIGSYTIDSLAPGGSFFLGQIVLTYDVYANGPGIDLISTDNRLTAVASVAVPAPIPEPSTLALLASGLTATYLGKRRRRSSAQLSKATP